MSGPQYAEIILWSAVCDCICIIMWVYYGGIATPTETYLLPLENLFIYQVLEQSSLKLATKSGWKTSNLQKACHWANFQLQHHKSLSTIQTLNYDLTVRFTTRIDYYHKLSIQQSFFFPAPKKLQFSRKRHIVPFEHHKCIASFWFKQTYCGVVLDTSLGRSRNTCIFVTGEKRDYGVNVTQRTW